jgi:Transposase DDE domain
VKGRDDHHVGAHGAGRLSPLRLAVKRGSARPGVRKKENSLSLYRSRRRDDGTFSRSDFRWDRRRGVYICPNNKVLHTTGTVHDGNTLRYRASKFDCNACALKMRCCPNMAARQVPRDVHEDARDMARRLMGTKRFLKSRDERKRVEMRFAHLKIHHGFERMRLRGLSGARDEFHLAAIVQNLKTMALRLLCPPTARVRASIA